jgi:hypothetical protein
LERVPLGAMLVSGRLYDRITGDDAKGKFFTNGFTKTLTTLTQFILKFANQLAVALVSSSYVLLYQRSNVDVCLRSKRVP